MSLWVRSDVGAATSTWTDQSPNSFILSAVGSPTLAAANAAHNYQPYYTGFSGSNYFVKNTGTTINPTAGASGNISTSNYAPIAMFGALNWSSTAGSGIVMGMDNVSGNSAQPAFVYSNGSGSSNVHYWNNSRTDAGTGLSGNAGQNNVFSYYATNGNYFGTGTPTGPFAYTMGIDGSQYTGSPAPTNSSLYSGGFLTVGSNGSVYGTYSGDIMESILYSATLTAAQVQQINSYLAIKYGVSLSQSTAYDYIAWDGTTHFWSNSSNTGYTNNIFGIGRDDVSALYQRQSNSVSSQNIAIFLGSTLAASNSANTGSFASNKQFVMLSDNGIASSTIATYAESAGTSFANGASTLTMSNRSGQIWKSQLTGFAGSTTIGISVSSSVYPYANYILVSTSSSFTPSSTSIYPLTSGVATNVSLTNGCYIAIGMLQPSPGGISNGLSFWARADIGAGATTWTDQSPNGFILTAVGSPTLATANAAHNYQPYYTGFSGSNYFVKNTGTTINPTAGASGNISTSNYAPIAMFGALNWSSTAGSGIVMGMDNASGNSAQPAFVYSNASGSSNVHYWNNSRTDAGTGLSGNAGQNNVFSYYATNGNYFGTGTPTGPFAYTMGIDGVQYTGSPAPTNSSLYSGGFLTVGSNGTVYGTYSGDIMESILYSATLTAAQVLQINSYLAIKYGVTMGSNSKLINYVNSGGSIVWTAASPYQNNIAGIERDDLSGLNQKQSMSQISPASNQITIGLTSIASTNAANTNSFIADRSSLIWGDNGVSSSLSAANTSVTFAGLASAGIEMNRIWQIQVNNFSQSVQIFVPSSMINETLTSCQSIGLITGTTATLNAPALSNVIPMVSTTINGVAGYVGSYIFPSGTSYFTFGEITSLAPGNAYLPSTTTASLNSSSCTSSGWTYFYADAGQTEKLFAINPNGNSSWNAANFSGTINVSTGDLPYIVTDMSGNESAIMARSYTIKDASSGTYSTNGGIKIRVYYNASEVTAATLVGGLSGPFEHTGNLATTLSYQIPMGGITGAVTFFPGLTSTSIENGVTYGELDGVTSVSTSTFGFVSTNNFAPLPINLVSFTANEKQCQAILNWESGSESGLQEYVLEYSLDAASFSTLAVIKPTGSNHNYTYTFNLSNRNNIYYFRLRMVSQDGKFSYSQVLNVQPSPDCATSSTIRLYPVPANNNITISGLGTDPHSITMMDSRGTIINTYTIKQNKTDLDISNLSEGIYFMKVTDAAGQVTVLKFIKN